MLTSKSALLLDKEQLNVIIFRNYFRTKLFVVMIKVYSIHPSWRKQIKHFLSRLGLVHHEEPGANLTSFNLHDDKAFQLFLTWHTFYSLVSLQTIC